MTSQRNDCYGPGSMTWPAANSATTSDMIANMVRRNSMQPLPFMDFSFFPVREEQPLPVEFTKPPSAPAAVVTPMASRFHGISSVDAPLPPIMFPNGVDPNQFQYYHYQNYHQQTAAPHSLEVLDDRSSGGDPVSEPTAAAVSLDSSEHSVSMSTSSEDNQRFKPFHEEKWSHRYKELLEFHRAFGHAAVPHTYPKNPQLARWVKRQRRQFKLRQEGKPSTMTTERLELLDSVGFIWDSHDLNWREKLEALTAYKVDNGHCNVPSNYKDKKLATWVKCQRRQYKLYWDGKPSAMTSNRITALERVGFEWEIRTTASKAAAATTAASVAAVALAAATAVAPAATVVSSAEQEEDPLPVNVASTIGSSDHFLLATAFSDYI